MTQATLPPWGDDALSSFLAQAQYNERVTPLKLPDIYSLLRRVHAAFQKVADITERENTPALLPSRFLMARAHSAWLAAVRLALSAQTVEAYPLARVVAENAWYALHIAKDCAPPARVEIWLNRDDDDAAQKRCANEFSIASVRQTHASLDAVTEGKLYTVYRDTITFGGHPNERGVLAGTVRTADGFGQVFLSDNPVVIAAALKTVVEAAVGALKTVRLIFPERFAIMSVDGDIDKVVDELNTVFKAQVPRP